MFLSRLSLGDIDTWCDRTRWLCRQVYPVAPGPYKNRPIQITNQNSLFMSRDWLSANQGPVFPDSVGSCLKQSNLMGVGDTSKHPIRTRYLGHVTGNQPITDQCFLIRSVSAVYLYSSKLIILDPDWLITSHVT
eukprot:sb/3474835/